MASVKQICAFAKGDAANCSGIWLFPPRRGGLILDWTSEGTDRFGLFAIRRRGRKGWIGALFGEFEFLTNLFLSGLAMGKIFIGLNTRHFQFLTIAGGRGLLSFWMGLGFCKSPGINELRDASEITQ